MGTEFDKFKFHLDEGISLPRNTTLHQLGDKYLYIWPEKGTWLTVDAAGSRFIQRLISGETLGCAAKELNVEREENRYVPNMDVKSLLRQIVIKQFHEEDLCEDDSNINPPEEFDIQFHLTQKCNLRCKHCYMDSGTASPGELGIADWKHVVDEFVDLGGNSVTYSGGEPLLFPDFYELAEYVKERSLDTMLITNGTLIQDASTAQSLAQLVNKIRISVDGATENTHDCIRGKGTFLKVNRAISLLSEKNADLEIAITTFPENIDDITRNITNYLSDLADRGIKLDRIGIARGLQQGRACDSINIVDFEHKFREIHRRIYGEFWDLSRFRPVKTVNCAYGQGFTVSSTGNIYPCGVFFRSEGNVKVDSLADIYPRFQQTYHQTSVDNMLLCRDCDLRYICGGGCRVYNLKYNGDILQPICSPKKREKFYLCLIGRDEIFFKLSQRLADLQAKL